jgi:hypothetical protein
MVRRVPFAFHPANVHPNPVFGTPQISIHIDIDEHGIMRTSINKPLAAVQVIGLLLDSMQGQYQQMVKQASLLIDPAKGEPLVRQEKESNDGHGRDTGERESTT